MREPHGLQRLRDRAQRTRRRPCAAADQSAHRFFFRSELQMTSERRPQRLRRGDLGPVLHLPGLQPARRLDAHLERRRQRRRVRRDHRARGRQALLPLWQANCARSRRKTITLSYRTPTARMAQRSFTTYATHHGPIVREADGKWIAFALMNRPIAALEQSFLRTKARDYASFLQGRAAARPTPRTTPCSPTPRARSPTCIRSSCRVRDDRFDYRKPVDGSDPATDWQGLHDAGRACRTSCNPPNGWVYQHQQLALDRGRRGQPEARRLSRATWISAGENPRGPHAVRVLTCATGLHPADADRRPRSIPTCRPSRG